MTRYTVTVTRDDDLWVALAVAEDGRDVGGLDFDRFEDLHVTMPEYIADMTGVDPSGVDIDWRYEIGGRDVTDTLSRLISVTQEAERANAEREELRSTVLRRLASAGISQRVMADVVGVSH